VRNWSPLIQINFENRPKLILP